jgi:putative ABC transport system substrate-binding protein
MNRRAFLCGLTGTLAVPFAAGAQPAGKVWRIGVLVPAEPASPTDPNIGAFRQGLRDLGYAEGQNIVVEYRYAHGKTELYPELVAQLVRLNVDVMVVGSGPATLAANGLLGSGFVGKWVELLKETAPRTTRVCALRDARNPVSERFLPNLQAAAEALGLKLQVLAVRELRELDSAFAAMSKEGSSGLVVFGEALFFPHRSRIPELVAKYRLPAIYEFRVFVDAGGLMSYGWSLPDLWRRAATYVDKILKGAKPGDLPVEQPTKFELVINLKTAKALGLTIPPSVLLQTNEVIE